MLLKFWYGGSVSHQTRLLITVIHVDMSRVLGNVLRTTCKTGRDVLLRCVKKARLMAALQADGESSTA